MKIYYRIERKEKRLSLLKRISDGRSTIELKEVHHSRQLEAKRQERRSTIELKGRAEKVS